MATRTSEADGSKAIRAYRPEVEGVRHPATAIE